MYDAFTSSPRALSLAGDILRNKAVEAVIAAARAVDSRATRLTSRSMKSPLDPWEWPGIRHC